jgi:hypothetical protein
MKLPFFNRELFESLPDDNDDAIVVLADEYARMLQQAGTSTLHDHDFLEAHAILEAFIGARGLNYSLPVATPPTVPRGPVRDFLVQKKSEAEKRIYARESTFHFERKSEEYRAMFSKTPVYEFSDVDFNRIQSLINELRDLIQKAVLIPKQHKDRLLKRLEAMQKELHKRTSDIDRFWGFIAEAGIVARKFGEDLQPINERVGELGRIVIAVIMAKEGIQALPDIVRLLQIK